MANDLIRSYEQDVASKIAGVDLHHVVVAALETTPNNAIAIPFQCQVIKLSRGLSTLCSVTYNLPRL